MDTVQAKVFTDFHLENNNLRKHCYGAAFVMEALAKKLHGNPDDWYIAGMVHDADFEQTKEIPGEHGKRTVEWLKNEGCKNENILSAILAHNYEHLDGQEPQTPMEWSLFCADHLTGFIVAVALVRPERNLASVTLESIMKKWGASAFAAGTSRKNISFCEEKLGLQLPEFIQIALSAMQEHHIDLGL
jgi:predicted hydrolase (HD superfamily)